MSYNLITFLVLCISLVKQTQEKFLKFYVEFYFLYQKKLFFLFLICALLRTEGSRAKRKLSFFFALPCAPSLLRSFAPSLLRSFAPSLLRSFAPSLLRSFACGSVALAHRSSEDRKLLRCFGALARPTRMRRCIAFARSLSSLRFAKRRSSASEEAKKRRSMQKEGVTR